MCCLECVSWWIISSFDHFKVSWWLDLLYSGGYFFSKGPGSHLRTHSIIFNTYRVILSLHGGFNWVTVESSNRKIIHRRHKRWFTDHRMEVDQPNPLTRIPLGTCEVVWRKLTREKQCFFSMIWKDFVRWNGFDYFRQEGKVKPTFFHPLFSLMCS